jgi:phosphonate transport system substrate-binding protein
MAGQRAQSPGTNAADPNVKGARSAPALLGGFDENLGFPIADPYWRSYFATENCEVDELTDLNALTANLSAHKYGFSYLPSANCFFIRSDPFYRGIASARAPRSGLPLQNSVMVVAKSNPVTDWQNLRGMRYGYINTFCTTSFFAPSILLAREGLALETFFDAFAVAPWQGQIDAVVDGAIDVTMVFEDVWLARAGNAQKTKIIARVDGLPTPAFIARTDASDAFTSNLTHKLLTYAAKPMPGALYSGFGAYQDAHMQRFFAELERLPGMSKMGGGARA